MRNNAVGALGILAWQALGTCRLWRDFGWRAGRYFLFSVNAAPTPG